MKISRKHFRILILQTYFLYSIRNKKKIKKNLKKIEIKISMI